MFIRTTAINKLLKLNKFIKAVAGGSSAGKTFGILPVEIDYAAKHPLTETSVVSESIPHLKRGAMKDFIKIMKETGRWNSSRWNASDFKYTFTNGSFIEFFSADVDSKLRGARRDRLYINECNNIKFEAYTELAIRTKQSIFLDWNPTNEFWFYTELMNDDNVDFITLTYKDNEAAPESAVNFIEQAKLKGEKSSYWHNWYRVYGEGKLGTLQGAVYSNWTQIDTIPSEAEYIGTGLDFGFTNDPTAAVDVFKWNGKLIFDEVLYQKGMHNNTIAEALRGEKRYIVADSAEPKSISELRQYGLTVIGAEKGRDSVNAGIQLIQQYDILVTKRSTNLIKELRGYVWQTDRSGATLNKPVDFLNHGLDSARYICQNRLSKKNLGNYAVS